MLPRPARAVAFQVEVVVGARVREEGVDGAYPAFVLQVELYLYRVSLRGPPRGGLHRTPLRRPETSRPESTPGRAFRAVWRSTSRGVVGVGSRRWGPFYYGRLVPGRSLE